MPVLIIGEHGMAGTGICKDLCAALQADSQMLEQLTFSGEPPTPLFPAVHLLLVHVSCVLLLHHAVLSDAMHEAIFCAAPAASPAHVEQHKFADHPNGCSSM